MPTTAELEAAAHRTLFAALRKLALVVGLPLGAAVTGAVGALSLDSPPLAPQPAPTDDPFPPALLLPPADEHLREACERSGIDARRAIGDARLCVDACRDLGDACLDRRPTPREPREPRDP